MPLLENVTCSSLESIFQNVITNEQNIQMCVCIYTVYTVYMMLVNMQGCSHPVGTSVAECHKKEAGKQTKKTKFNKTEKQRKGHF